MVSPISSVAAHRANTQIAPRALKATDADQTEEGPKVPGVIRNLIDGHYKGVADVRLRLVHADRIAALQLEADEDHAAATHGSMVTELHSELDTFVVANSTGDETADGALNSAASTFITAVERADLSIEDALAALEASLRDVLKPGPVEPAPVEAVESGEIALELVDSVGDLMTELRAIVDAAQAVPAANVLPPLADYSGNGKAYAKFLELYRATNESPVSVPLKNSIDLSA